MRRILEAFAVLLLLTAQGAHAAPARIAIELKTERSAPGSVQGVLKIASLPGAYEARTLEIPFEAPGEREIDLPPGSWEARFEAKGFWSETLTVSNQETGKQLRMRLFPSAPLRGRVVLPAGEKPLPALAIRLQPPFGPGQEKDLALELSCPIQDGQLACEAPAGRFDVRLRAEASFAPVYFWSFSIPSGKPTDLGEIVLRRGASVSGWVQTADGSPLSSGCRVKLSPAGASKEDGAVIDQMEKASFVVEPGKNGFFQIAGVPPGRYEITALQPGFAPASLNGVDVRPDLEAQVIERLVLDRPVSFEIAIDPPMEPYGHLWRIELIRRSDSSEIGTDTYTGNATADGTWKSPELAPGTYEVTIVGDLKSVWHREYVEVRKGQPPLDIRLRVLRVKGTLFLGDEPLSARLLLGGKNGGRVPFDSDERGRFSGVLPGEGLWVPMVEAEGVKSVLEPMEIRPPEGKGVAEIEIVVPDTALAGQVVNDSGKPVPGAKVLIVGTGQKRYQSQITTDEEGKFSVRGLRPGPVQVQALDGEIQSEYAQSAIPEEGAPPDLRLVLRRFRTLQGRVVSSTGGVPGAMVMAWTPFNGQMAANLAQSVTSLSGRFEISLPPDSSLLSLVVLPPGHALRLMTVVVTPGQTLEIPVDTQGGTLILERSENGPSPLLIHNGTFLLMPILEMWARLQGARVGDPTRLTVPNVSAGSYNVCVGAAAISQLRDGGEPPAASCASGVLAPNGELVLRSPAISASR